MKNCYSCKERKEVIDFYKNKARYDGLDSRCKLCRLQYKASNKNQNRAYYCKNKDKFIAYKRKHQENNKQYAKQYYLKNKEAIKLQIKHNKKQNPARINASNKLIKFKKSYRTPKWLSKAQIKEILNIYGLAAAMSQETGKKHHVDHIVPLNGKNVSGLHVPWNLQILEAFKNLEKSNKF